MNVFASSAALPKHWQISGPWLHRHFRTVWCPPSVQRTGTNSPRACTASCYGLVAGLAIIASIALPQSRLNWMPRLVRSTLLR